MTSCNGKDFLTTPEKNDVLKAVKILPCGTEQEVKQLFSRKEGEFCGIMRAARATAGKLRSQS